MKIPASICNVILIAFTCFVTLTDGAPDKAPYIALALLLVLIPVFNLVILFRKGKTEGATEAETSGGKHQSQDISPLSSGMKTAAIICNIVLLGFACWAIMDQYPHPREAGVIEYALIVILTPILTLAVISRGKRS